VLSLVIVAAIVMYAALGLILAIPDLGAAIAGGVADPISQTITTHLGAGIAKPLFAMVVLAFIAGIAAVQASVSRVIFALGRDGQLPAPGWFGTLSGRDSLPRNAIGASALAAGVLLFLAFSSAYLGVRQATAEQPLGQALLSAPTYLGDLRGFSNDNTAFDGLFQAVGWFGRSQDFRGGASALDALHSYVPSFIDPGKPPGADIQFREALWGEFLQGGRPYTVIGEFYADFGFPGIVLGSLLLGIVAGRPRGLVRPEARDEAGRAYRVALFACAMFVLYQLVIGTYAIGIGFALQLFGPLMLGVHVFGRRS